jgi:hypothetical protein
VTDEMHDPESVRHIIPCTLPGLTCCDFRLTGKAFDDNVMRAEVWCKKWRVQRDKEHVIRGCHPDYPK